MKILRVKTIIFVLAIFVNCKSNDHNFKDSLSKIKAIYTLSAEEFCGIKVAKRPNNNFVVLNKESDFQVNYLITGREIAVDTTGLMYLKSKEIEDDFDKYKLIIELFGDSLFSEIDFHCSEADTLVRFYINSNYSIVNQVNKNSEREEWLKNNSQSMLDNWYLVDSFETQKF